MRSELLFCRWNVKKQCEKVNCFADRFYIFGGMLPFNFVYAEFIFSCSSFCSKFNLFSKRKKIFEKNSFHNLPLL